MIDYLEKMTASLKVDYYDIRYETKHVEQVRINKSEIRVCDANTGDGYVLRVLHKGALATVNFTRPEQAEAAIRKAVENAEILAGNKVKPKQLAPAPVVVDTVKVKLAEDPRHISLGEKKELTNAYSELLFAQPRIVNVDITYDDVYRNKYYLNSEGTRINEELVTTRLSGAIIAQDGALTQPVRFAFGGSDGFQRVRNREQEALNKAKIAADLLKAEPVRAGTYKMILNPGMTGVFTHEAFGHFSEADIVRDLPSIREKMKLGTRLGLDELNIIDDATMSNQLGYYRYDDEGVPVRRVNLMTNGVLTGRLHDRFTAAEMGESISGHSIAEDFRYAPIVRMGCIFIQPDRYSLDELMASMEDGLYIGDPMGGQTTGENFTFGAQYGYIVKGGKFAGMIRDINLVGNLYKTLLGVSMIGKDFELKEVGGCGKEQTNIRSCHGGPHVLVDELTVGGR
ncbi:MAG: TldD/PmbA family protein [Candidatus Cloacimonadaceae bacterium]|jgi:TldD protein|nr:TldD/PmbA family protein [Candidatus Cloacimonadaceae bacterium]